MRQKLAIEGSTVIDNCHKPMYYKTYKTKTYK